MIKIRIPRKELNTEFIHRLDVICGELNLDAHVTVADVLPVPVLNIAVDGELAGEEGGDG
jgi:hypothetical protein